MSTISIELDGGPFDGDFVQVPHFIGCFVRKEIVTLELPKSSIDPGSYIERDHLYYASNRMRGGRCVFQYQPR
jgi:hypothetical protein